MYRNHRDKRPKPSRSTFPSREWLLAQQRLLQIQKELWAKNAKGGRMTQQNVRGCYMNFEHDRAQDWDWLAKWQPNVVRLMVQGKLDDPNSVSMNRIRRVHDTVPDATILLRCWEVDDNGFKAHDAMVADPIGTAIRQVDWWAKVFDRAESAGIPRGRLMAGLNNETGPEKDGPLYAYSVQALDTGTKRGVRLGVFVFSVGRPSLPGEAQYTIDTFEQLDNAILANNGAVLLHEYLQPEGMYCVWVDEHGNERKDYTYLVGRHLRWQIKAPIIIAEWGIDGILYNRHPDPEHGNSGWRNFPQEWWPDRYADEYVECVRKSSDNVIGICPFISDPSDNKWFSFDPLPAYGALLARKDQCVKQVDSSSTPPATVHLPAIGTPPAPAPSTRYVAVLNGANLRTAPDLETGDIMATIGYGESVDVDGYDTGSDGKQWARARYIYQWGWVRADLLGDKPPASTPEPPQPAPQPGDNWSRAWPIVLKIEGGLSLDPNDTGNYYQGKLVGTKFGISAAVWGGQYDIPNLTKEQALEIYKAAYWDAVNADALPWPICLIRFDTAINHGVGVAKALQEHVETEAEIYLGLRMLRYIHDPKWKHFGIAWGNRVAHLDDIAKGKVSA